MMHDAGTACRTPEFEALRGELLHVAASGGGTITFRDFQSAVYRLTLPVAYGGGDQAMRGSPRSRAAAAPAPSGGIWNVPPLGQ